MELVLIVLVVLVVAILGYAIAVYNGLISVKNAVESSWRQIDVQLKRRHDLIPNLVNSVKGHMDFEKDTLTRVVEARAAAVSAADRGSSIAAEGLLGQALGRLLAVVEAYPDLKSQANVSQLMEELSTTENKIAFARQHYNDTVEAYNNKTQKFPSNIVAGTFGFKDQEYFAIADDHAAHEAPNVSLS